MERISAFPGFHLCERLNQVEPFRFGEPGEGSLLCFEAQTRFALLSRGDPGVGDGRFHRLFDLF